MQKLTRFRTIGIIVVAVLAAALQSPSVQAAKAVKKTTAKPAAKKPAPAKPAAVAQPKIIKVVDVYAADPITFKQTGTKIEITLAPEEYEPAAVLVKSPKPIPGAKLTLFGDLVMGTAKLEKSNVSAWAVTDGVMQKGATGSALGEPSVDLATGVQQFWIRAYAPKGTKPGTYKGTLLVSTDKHIGSIPIEVTVLSLRLLRSSKQYGMLIPFTVSDVSDGTYKTYLGELYNSGFSVSALPEPPASAPEAFAAYKGSRLGVHGIYTACLNGSMTANDIAAVEAARRASGASELFYLGADRPCDFSAALQVLDTMRSARVRTAARIDSQEAYDALKDSVNAFIYEPSVPYVQSLLAGETTRSNGKREWYCWDASTDPMKNRIYAGLMLWKSNLDGAYIEPGPVDYKALQQPDPKALLVPVEDGVLPTVKWEMLREGIDDTRYITTLMTVVREAKDQKVGKTITDEAEAYLSAFLKKPYDTLTTSDLQKFRAKLAQYIIKLRGIVKS